jgi:hypothetical protein
MLPVPEPSVSAQLMNEISSRRLPNSSNHDHTSPLKHELTDLIGPQQQNTSIPIPNDPSQYAGQDPRPQEAGMGTAFTGSELENDLIGQDRMQR